MEPFLWVLCFVPKEESENQGGGRASGVAEGCTAAFHPLLRRGRAQLGTVAVAPGTYLDSDLGAGGEGVVCGFGCFCVFTMLHRVLQYELSAYWILTILASVL